MKFHHRIALALLVSIAPSLALSQVAYPNQPIRLIVPWPPGGGVDTSARIISAPLSVRLGQNIVIDNRPGAAGNIGTEQASKAKADGYTLLMGSLSPNGVNPHLYLRLGFDPVKDFSMIALVATVPSILVVKGDSPINSVKELLAVVKAKGSGANYGSGGVGSSQHLSSELFKKATQLEILHVPYKGTAPAELGLMAGEVDLLLDTTACLPFVAAGRMKALAVAAKTRSPALPNVPTLDEAGVPGVYAGAWYGIMGPAGMPKDVVERLNREILSILQTPEMSKRMLEFGAESGSGSPEWFTQFVASEVVRYADIVKLAGLKKE